MINYLKEMRILNIFCLVISLSLVSAQESIAFEQLSERYDTTDGHQFLRHLYKNLKFPEEYSRIGNLAILEVKFTKGSWEVLLIRSYFPNHDTFILDIVHEALQFLKKPDYALSTKIKVKFNYVWRDERKNIVDFSNYDIVVSRFEPIRCGSLIYNNSQKSVLDRYVDRMILNKANTIIGDNSERI